MVNIEDSVNLSREEKVKRLNELIKNDVNYWQKILLLTATMDEEDMELIDKIVKNKREEIQLFENKYSKDLLQEYYINYIKNNFKNRDYSQVMKKLIENDNNNNMYNKASKEVLEVLKYVPNEYLKKINSNFLERLQINEDTEYKFKISYNTSFEKIKFLEETKDLFSLIINKFWNDE